MSREPQRKGSQPGLVAFMAERMPGCAQALQEAVQRHGAAWITQCVDRAMKHGQPGWFWAAEGGWAVGTPTAGQVVAWFDDDRPAFVLAVANPMGA